MPTYIVTDKSTGTEVYRYQSDAPVEWGGMAFASHDHAILTEPEPVVTDVIVKSMTFTKREFLKRFTPDEYTNIKGATTASATLDYYWQMFMLADNITTTDDDTITGVTTLEQVGLIAAGRAQEILNG